LQAILWFLGFGLITYNTNLWVGFGFWFMLWSNNINIIENKIGKHFEN
jgi:hypothetical protein